VGVLIALIATCTMFLVSRARQGARSSAACTELVEVGGGGGD